MIKGNVAIFPVKKSAKSIRGIKSYDCFSWEIFPPSFPHCWEGAFPTLWEGAFPTLWEGTSFSVRHAIFPQPKLNYFFHKFITIGVSDMTSSGGEIL